MTGLDSKTHWQDVYASKATTAVSWYQETPAPSLDLLQLAGAGPETGIIDVGGGASILADTLLALGYGDLSVLDISPAALEAAQARLGRSAGKVEWIVADVTQWRPERSYDIWHDRAAFHFLVEENSRIAYVERLRSALPVGGHVIIGTFAPDGPEKCSGLIVQRYDARSLGAALGAGFRLIDSRRYDHLTPWRAVQHFHFGTFCREA
ncbi:MAG TPA: class I SAM-dependent methyltransferase [Mesorhizobium sp.]|jgi:trans-aconitate methyltransferase|uniref:class I SAM-dependent methyltransferase n=1 Tax=Mesorhizobium sp. TaxID=1871066 RepID=UPI002DDD7B99|nr:class I SAM-dependent methyltransferase [Mesorhizobium sp.]HEV2504883.1 class I SAM-dependent methyltransferase [Mesorhizobium sp.]